MCERCPTKLDRKTLSNGAPVFLYACRECGHRMTGGTNLRHCPFCWKACAVARVNQDDSGLASESEKDAIAGR